MSPRLCRCHGAVMLKDRREWRCAIRTRAKNKLAAARYRRTANGQAHQVRNNARRIYIEKRCVGHAATLEDARRINRIVQGQCAAFRAHQMKERHAAFTR